MWSPICFFTIPFTEFKIVAGDLGFKIASILSLPLKSAAEAISRVLEEATATLKKTARNWQSISLVLGEWADVYKVMKLVVNVAMLL
jgi:hypothetical protein